MDDSQGTPAAIEVDGLSVNEVRGLQIASLRYFDPAGSFAARVRETVGRSLPEPMRALQVDRTTEDARVILLWRSPTETMLICSDRAAFAEIARQLAADAHGCMVDQSGGVYVLRVQGPRARDLLMRLGATTAIPGLGEARSGRLAELQVLTACLQTGEFLLLVEQVYANHLREWIEATAADF
jgi:heterotetrameric sarcosine oxidase gamma subunit